MDASISNKLFSYDNVFSAGQMLLPVGEIRQISELSLIPGGTIVEHVQICDEITYVISGKAQIWSGDECMEMSAGQIHYIKNGVRHKITASSDSSFHYICIGLNLNEDYIHTSSFLQEVRELDYFFAVDDGRIRKLSELMIHEFYMQDSQSNSMVNAYLIEILVILYRIMRGTAPGDRKKISRSASNFAVYHAIQYINREYLTIKSVKGIAKELNYSEYYLSHLFRKKMGVTVKEYILERKLIDAAELLKSSNMSITEIAEQMNFSSAHTFRQAFKRYMRISPTELRQKENANFRCQECKD